jgi:hypothetical protein
MGMVVRHAPQTSSKLSVRQSWGHTPAQQGCCCLNGLMADESVVVWQVAVITHVQLR